MQHENTKEPDRSQEIREELEVNVVAQGAGGNTRFKRRKNCASVRQYTPLHERLSEVRIRTERSSELRNRKSIAIFVHCGCDTRYQLSEIPVSVAGCRPLKRRKDFRQRVQDETSFRRPPTINRSFANARTRCNTFDGQLSVTRLAEKPKCCVKGPTPRVRIPSTFALNLTIQRLAGFGQARHNPILLRS